jgi:L-ascorbate metabolism protein UlaG (beta-lactamase superfamily)
VTYGEREPLVVKGPGEYEIAGTMIRGYASKGASDLINTVYYFEFDDMKICFLGALYEGTLSTEAREAIDTVDILFVPIGGKSVINAEVAAKLARTFEAKMVIPMDYGKDQDETSLKTFLKEIGGKQGDAVEKLTLKSKDLASKEVEVVVFK